MNKLKENVLGIVTFVVLIIMLITECFMPTFVKKEKKQLAIIEGAYTITFPYEGNDVEFDDGWVGQSEGEAYRWVRKKSSIYARLSNQSYICVSGYVPEGFDVTNAKLYVNKSKVMETGVVGGQPVVLEGNIGKLIKKNKRNEIRIVFDKERIPDESSPDQRVFSALVSSIELQ